MAMLGLLHRIILNDVVLQLVVLFPFAVLLLAEASATRRYSAWLFRQHNKQVNEQTINIDILRRSLFGLAYIYNLLLQSTSDLRSVRHFNSALQRALRLAASQTLLNWKYICFLDCDQCGAFISIDISIVKVRCNVSRILGTCKMDYYSVTSGTGPCRLWRSTRCRPHFFVFHYGHHRICHLYYSLECSILCIIDSWSDS